MTTDDLQPFFDRYARAVESADLKRISASYTTPALVLSDQGAIPVATAAEVEQAFAGAAEDYRARGLATARPTVGATESLTPTLATADVTWAYLDAEGTARSGSRYRYLLRHTADGPSIQVVIALPAPA